VAIRDMAKGKSFFSNDKPVLSNIFMVAKDMVGGLRQKLRAVIALQPYYVVIETRKDGSSVLSMLNYLNLVLKALHSNALRIISTKSML